MCRELRQRESKCSSDDLFAAHWLHGVESLPASKLLWTMLNAPTPPVFLDPTGRRWRRVRGAALGIGVASSLLAALLVAAVLIPPVRRCTAPHPVFRRARAPRWAGTPCAPASARRREARRGSWPGVLARVGIAPALFREMSGCPPRACHRNSRRMDAQCRRTHRRCRRLVWLAPSRSPAALQSENIPRPAFGAVHTASRSGLTGRPAHRHCRRPHRLHRTPVYPSVSGYPRVFFAPCGCAGSRQRKT